MGGVGSGGRRPGSGPKTKSRDLKVLEGNPGKRPLGPATSREERVKPPQPESLSPKEAAIWQWLAPLAFEAQTLATNTVPAMILLCKLHVMADEMYQTLLEEGFTFIKHVPDADGGMHEEPKAHPLVSQHRQTCQRVEALMGRFGIAPFGKPLGPSPKNKPAVNPWAGIAG